MPADSMTEQNFHEIQLSGKQLVFVFMSAVVVAVVIFLLGVSVGRGVRDAVPSGTDVSAAPASAPSGPAAAPPSGGKQAGPGDLTYHDVLQGKAPATGASSQPPPPDPTPQPAVAAPPAAPPPAETKAADSAKGSTASTKASDAGADSKSGARGTSVPTAATGWFVQVNTFNAKENAEKQVQQLKAKSYSAFVYSPIGPVTRFHVRLGPFAQRPEAERMAARLVKEGFTPLITR